MGHPSVIFLTLEDETESSNVINRRETQGPPPLRARWSAHSRAQPPRLLEKDRACRDPGHAREWGPPLARARLTGFGMTTLNNPKVNLTTAMRAATGASGAIAVGGTTP